MPTYLEIINLSYINVASMESCRLLPLGVILLGQVCHSWQRKDGDRQDIPGESRGDVKRTKVGDEEIRGTKELPLASCAGRCSVWCDVW